MDEMTAAEKAVHVLKLCIQYNDDAEPDDCKLALQVIEQQAQEIATSEQKYKNWIGPIEHKSLFDEIAKKDRMIEILIDKLIEDIGECPSVGNCHVNFDGKSDDESNEICRKCWLAWLEKEAQGGYGMKASELNRILETMLSRRNDDFDIVVAVKEPWVGPTPAIAIKQAHIGFDWDSGRIILVPTLELCLKNHDVLKTHTLDGKPRKEVLSDVRA